MDRRYLRTGTNLTDFERWRDACVEHLRGGGIAILPTETGYMMAVNGLDREALENLYVSKGRPAGRATHLAVHSIEAGEKAIHLSTSARSLLCSFAPGPLTVIGPAKDHVPREIWGPNETLGVRLPDHPLTQDILQHLKLPLTATSANMAGKTHETALERILSQFQPATWENWFLLEDDHRQYEKPSTMILQKGEQFSILREGPISQKDLNRCLEQDA